MMKLYRILIFLLILGCFVSPAEAVTVTSATNGTAISSDTFFTSQPTALTGLIIAENVDAEITPGNIIITVPNGFLFDSSQTVTATSGGNNLLLNGGNSQTVYAGSGTIIFTVSSNVADGTPSSVSFSDIYVLPETPAKAVTGELTVITPGPFIDNTAGTLTTVSGDPFEIILLDNNPLTGITAGAVQSLGIEVKDRGQNSVTNGFAVTFAPDNGLGSFAAPNQATDASGQARTDFTTAVSCGTNRVKITLPAYALVPAVYYELQTIAGAAAITTAVTAPEATVFTGVTAGDQRTLTVRVTDANNNPVAGNTVTFANTAGSGSMSAASVTTDSAGLASIVYITGGTAGTNTVTAQGAGTAGAVTFNGVTIAGTNAFWIGKITSDPVTGVTAGANQTLTVEVQDKEGNLILNTAGLVTFAVVSGGGSIAEAQPMTTDGSGRASATLTTGTSVGRNVVSVSVSGAATLFYEVETIAGAAAITTAVTAPEATVFTGVTAGDQRTLTVRVTDANNNPVAGNTVTFANTAGSGSMSAASVTTDSAGLASIVYITGGTAGTNTVTAQGAGTAGAVTFNGVTIAGTNAFWIGKITSDPVTGVTAGANQTLTVEVQDKEGNLILNTAGLVTFAVVSGGGSIAEAQPMATDGSGRASATLTTGTSVGRNVVSVSVSGAATLFYEVETIAGAAAITTAVTAPEATVFTGVTAGDQRTLTVRVTDANNNPVAGNTVTFANTAGSGSMSAASVTTDSAGLASIVYITGGTAGTNTVTAQGAGTAGAVIFNGLTIAGTNAFWIGKITSDPVTGVTAGANQTLTVEVQDKEGNLILNTAGLVTFAVVSGGGSIAEAQPMATDGSGRASATLTTGTSVGRNVVSVSVSGAATLFYEVETIAGAAAITTAVTAPEATVFTGVTAGDQRTLTVKVTDANNNPVAGNTVTFANTAGSGSMSAASVTTDINGLASIVYITGGTVGTNTVTAQGAGTAGAVTFTGITVLGSAREIVKITSDPVTGVTAGANQTLTVEVRDNQGNPLVSQAGLVTFAVVSGGGSIAEAQPADTGLTGRASATLTTGTSVGRNVVSVSVSGAVTLFYEVETIAGAAAITTAVTVPAATVFTGVTAGDQRTLTVRVTDANNNPVAGNTVTFANTAGSGSMSAASVTTDINGLASIVYITGGTVGTNTVTAQGAGTAGAVTFTGITVLGSAREIVKITSDPVTGVTAGANQTLTVEVRDNQGNPLVSQAGLVTFAMVSGGGSIAEAQPMATDGSGRASATLTTGTSVGRNVVSVSVSGAVTLFYEVETIAGTAAITTAVTAPAATVFTGVTAGDQRTLTVKVTDANNNPVAGNIVTFANTAGSGSMSAASVTTDINGLASIVYITGGTAGTNTVTAQGAGTAGAVTFTGITVAGNYYSLIYRISPSLISGIIAGQNQTLSVEVRDLSGTPIANTAGLVTFAVVSGGGSITEVQPMATDGSGQASATLTTGTSVGRNVVSVSVSGAVPVIYEVETIAGAASQVSIISQDPGNIRAGEQFLVTAQVVDVNNNPVSNESVTWNIAQGNGTVMPVDLKTGLLGTARAEFTTSINSGLNSITASANSITSAAFNITTKKWDDFAVKISSLNSSDALLEEVTGAFEVEFSHLLDGSGGYSDITINSIKVTVSDENNKEIAPDSIIQKFIVKSDSGSQTYIETSSISSTNPQTLALVPAPVIQAGGSSVKLKVYYVVKANTTEDYVKVSIKRYDDIDAIVTGGMPARAIVDVDSLLLSSAAAVKAPYEIELYSDQQDNTKLWIRIYDKRSNTALPSVKIVQNGFSIPALANVILAEEDSSDTVAPKYYRGEYKVINGYSGSAAVYVNNILVDNVFIGRPVYTAPAIQVLTSSDKQDPASITIPVGSLAATPEFMAILPGFSASRSGELIAVGKMRHIGPLNFTLGSGCILKMTYSDDQVLGRDESKTGIYKFSVLTRKWEYLRDSKVNAGTNSVEAQITSGGTYSLFSDETAPEIVDIKEIIVSELSRDENMRIKDALMGIRAFASNDTVPVARALVNDFGSGINSEKIEVYVDSHLQNQSSWIYNPQEGRIYFLADASLGEGDHQISFSVSDYSGNISQAKSSVFTLSGAQNIVSLRPYPNPAQVISKIRYELAHPADEVILKIYNNADHHIISIEGTSFAGVNEIIWDLTDESGFEAANGIYPVLLRVKTGNEIMEKITTIAVLR